MGAGAGIPFRGAPLSWKAPRASQLKYSFVPNFIPQTPAHCQFDLSGNSIPNEQPLSMVLIIFLHNVIAYKELG